RLEPTLTWTKIAALALSSLINLSTIALLLGGVWCIVATWFAPGFVLLGVLMILMGLEVRPHAASLSPEARALDPDACPHTYAAVTRIADAMQVPMPHRIVITPAFSASVIRIGATRRRYVFLGLPLLYVLDPQERVAAIAH